MNLSLVWRGGLHFTNAPGSPAVELASSAQGVASPPQALAYAVMACMAMDVVYVIEKARHTLAAMTVRFDGERAPQPPRRFVTMTIHFEIAGDVPEEAVDRAIALSREKYCSVWHTIRPDVALTTTFHVANAGGEAGPPE
jgi:putative redox protein